MSATVVLPIWLSVLSLALALFVPCGVGLIADISVDGGNRANIEREDDGHFVSPDEWIMTPMHPAAHQAEKYHSEEGRNASYGGRV